MSNPVLRTLFGTVELRPVASPAGSPQGARVFVLLPDLDELLGVPGFGLRNPIRTREGHAVEVQAVRGRAGPKNQLALIVATIFSNPTQG